MKNIIVSGSTGLVGSRILELLREDFNFIPLLVNQVDITKSKEVDEFIDSKDFDLFLHLAAYTNVNGAELEKDIAYKVNVEGTKNVSSAVLKKNKEFIYMSTDFVFSGDDKEKSYTEDDKPNPSGVYASSKYEGEKIVNKKAMITRISFPYRARFEAKKDFVSSIKSMLERGQEIHAVTDSIITPTFIDDIAFSIKYLIN
ncbi:MAG: sugar nucleotide-binding protein, partial [Patescibacteria group bacterium]